MSTETVMSGIADKIGNGMDRVITDAEKFATEFIRRIDSVAPQVASEIKKITLYAWNCLVKQQLAEGIFYTIFAVLIPVGVWLYFKYVVNLFKDKNGNFEDPWDGFFTFVTVIGLIVCTIVFGCLMFNGITHLISPEYYAVEELLTKFGAFNQKSPL